MLEEGGADRRGYGQGPYSCVTVTGAAAAPAAAPAGVVVVVTLTAFELWRSRWKGALWLWMQEAWYQWPSGMGNHELALPAVAPAVDEATARRSAREMKERITSSISGIL